MTHDELLARIVKLSVTPETNVVPSELATALMAVVELHRPIFRGCDEPSCCGDEDVCRCSDEYPCDTIKAIEKQLA